MNLQGFGQEGSGSFGTSEAGLQYHCVWVGTGQGHPAPILNTHKRKASKMLDRMKMHKDTFVLSSLEGRSPTKKTLEPPRTPPLYKYFLRLLCLNIF